MVPSQLVNQSHSLDNAATSRGEGCDDAPPFGGLCPYEVAHLMDMHRVKVVDVRDPQDFLARRIAGSLNVPATKVPTDGTTAASEERLILCCDTGEKSRGLATKFGRSNVDYLRGGLDAWAGAGLRLLGR